MTEINIPLVEPDSETKNESIIKVNEDSDQLKLRDSDQLKLGTVNTIFRYDWGFLLDRDLGIATVKTVVDLINRSQKIDVYDYNSKCPNSDVLKLASAIAACIKDIGLTIQSMGAIDEVVHVGDLIGMYAHLVEILVNCHNEYVNNWAVDMALRIKKSEQKICFVEKVGAEDIYSCLRCYCQFMTLSFDGDTGARYCPYCGQYEQNIIK